MVGTGAWTALEMNVMSKLPFHCAARVANITDRYEIRSIVAEDSASAATPPVARASLSSSPGPLVSLASRRCTAVRSSGSDELHRALRLPRRLLASEPV